VIKNIVDSAFYEIVQILIRNRESSSSPIWMPKWEFDNDIDKQKANDIIAACQKSLFLSKILIFVESVNNSASELIEIAENAMCNLHELLEQNEPGDLVDWLPRLSHENNNE